MIGPLPVACRIEPLTREAALGLARVLLCPEEVRRATGGVVSDRRVDPDLRAVRRSDHAVVWERLDPVAQHVLCIALQRTRAVPGEDRAAAAIGSEGRVVADLQ